MTSSGNKKGSLDPVVLATVLRQLDQDIAVRFVASAFSLSSRKIREAYDLALHEMIIRDEEEEKKRYAARKIPVKKAGKPVSKNNFTEVTDNLLEDVKSLLQSKTGKNIEVKFEVLSDEELDSELDEFLNEESEEDTEE